jgi:hypothetical protein
MFGTVNLSPFPAPPTDNLYKFQALSGLVLMVGCFFFFSDRVEKLQTQRLEIENSMAMSTIESKYLAEDSTNLMQNLDTLQAKADNLIQEKDKLQRETNNVQEREDSIKLSAQEDQKVFTQLKEARNQLFQRGRDFRLKVQEIKNKSDLLNNAAGQTKEYLRYMAWIMPAVIFWTLWGFGNWYSKIQIYQDRILKHEAAQYGPKKSK